MQLWLNEKEVQRAVEEYVERHVIKEGQHVESVAKPHNSILVILRDTMEELAK